MCFDPQDPYIGVLLSLRRGCATGKLRRLCKRRRIVAPGTGFFRSPNLSAVNCASMGTQPLMQNALRGIAVLLLAALPTITGCKGFFVPVCQETNTCPGQVATPTASPAAGAYSGAQTVSLSDTTSGATICYTTNGSAPTATTPGTCSNGTIYTSPIAVSATATIRAIATLSGSTNSPVLTSTYTIM